MLLVIGIYYLAGILNTFIGGIMIAKMYKNKLQVDEVIEAVGIAVKKCSITTVSSSLSTAIWILEIVLLPIISVFMMANVFIACDHFVNEKMDKADD